MKEEQSPLSIKFLPVWMQLGMLLLELPQEPMQKGAFVKVYQSGKTLHLFSSCRRTKGTPLELDVFIHQVIGKQLILSGALDDCNRLRQHVCGMCRRRWNRILQSLEVHRLKEEGLTLQQIGDMFGVSRQYVWQLVQEVE